LPTTAPPSANVHPSSTDWSSDRRASGVHGIAAGARQRNTATVIVRVYLKPVDTVCLVYMICTCQLLVHVMIALFSLKIEK
jgi:hypothetical protein